MGKYDLHIHTTFSDGTMTVEDVLKKAKHIGLSGISITDHDTLSGSLKALSMQKDYGILVVPGIEVSTRYGHILVYGLTELKYSSINELIDIVHENDGLLAIAHPYGKFTFLKYPIVDMAEILEKADAIECYNGKTIHSSNVKAKHLATKLKKPCIGGSDAHIIEEVGSVLTLISENVESIDDFISAVKKGNTKVLGYKSLFSIISSMIIKGLRCF